MTHRTVWRAAAVLALAVVCAACSRGSGDTAKSFTLAVIPKGTTNEFWKSTHAGAVKAADELKGKGVDVSIIWKGPLREDDREQQVQVVEGFLSQGVSGLVLAPLDERALVRPVEEAARAGIPTLIFDSDLASKEIVSFVATDNYQGGVLAAREMGKLLDGKGNVLLLRYQEGSASTTFREEGFLDTLKKEFPDIHIVSSDQYAGATRDTAKRASENLLNRFGPRLQGIFCVNESSTAGMLLALQDINRAGRIKLIGFDSTQAFIDAMRAGQLHGLVVQDPLNMGYRAVLTMVDYLQKKPVDKRVDTGVWMITPQNIDDERSQVLLKPPYEKYLGEGQ
jgi:ribose transport system substrate-binding protein